MKRRRPIPLALGVVAIVILAGGLLGWQASRDGAEKAAPTMTLAAYAGDLAALAFLAQEEGLFEKHGVDVTLLETVNGSESFNAVTRGEADVATLPELGFIARIPDHPDMRVFGSLSVYEIRGVVGRRDRGISSASDLQGKRVGLSGDMSTYYLGVFLPVQGVQYGDVEAVLMPPLSVNDAVLTGEVDAAVTWEPHLTALKRELGDNGVSFNLPPEISPVTTLTLLARQSWLDENQEAAARLLRALKEAEGRVAADPDAAWTRIAARFDLAPDYVAAVRDRIRFRVELSQRLLLSMEAETRWSMAKGLLPFDAMPNYLDYLALQPLATVDPASVTVLQ